MVRPAMVALMAMLVTTATAQTFINYSGGHPLSYRSSGRDPCAPSPCGPNTRCSINTRGLAACRCLDGYFPKPNTIAGCGPQCTSDSECQGSQYICRNQKCIDPCREANPCGINAECSVQYSQVRCKCPHNYEGSPYSRCYPSQVTGRAIGPAYTGAASNVAYHTQNTVTSRVGPPAPPPSNPCSRGVCGANAECNNVNGRAVCSCPAGYQGDPLTGCRRGECTDDGECPRHQACIDLRCQNPCSRGVCGSQAECTVENHGAICKCPTNYLGDPFVSCRYDPAAACTPSPCGTNTNCEVKSGQAVCSCVNNYIGDPLTSCRPECVSSAECSSHQACIQNRCRNVCTDACGPGARCEGVNHQAICSCPQHYKGTGLSGCYPECTSPSECPSHQTCYQLQCSDPCKSACGINAECNVVNHKAICKCPRGYEGHPFDRCTPAPQSLCDPNPCGTYAECNDGHDSTGKPRPVCTCPRGYFGDALVACQRGQCEVSTDCPPTQTCYSYSCVNPCISQVGGNVCGTNALCNSNNHKAVCYCPSEYTGDPLTECRLKPKARSNNRRYKRFLERFTPLLNAKDTEELEE